MMTLEMIDKELEDFENEKNKHKGLKSLLNFNSSLEYYDGTNLNSMEIKPVFKKKFKTSIYIKDNKNNNSLF